MSEKEKIVCSCLDLKKQDIMDAINEKGAKNLEDIEHETRAGMLCGICVGELKEILNENGNK